MRCRIDAAGKTGDDRIAGPPAVARQHGREFRPADRGVSGADNAERGAGERIGVALESEQWWCAVDLSERRRIVWLADTDEAGAESLRISRSQEIVCLSVSAIPVRLAL